MKKLFINAMCALALVACWSCNNDEPDAPGKEDNPETPTTPTDVPEGTVVLAYAPYYSPKAPLAAAVTHINYAFAEVYVRDDVYQTFKLQGNESTFQTVVNLKKLKPGIKILLSFTNGVSNSDNVQGGGFSAIAASDENRKKFAKDCLSFVQKWGIDGIDLDWEFPGLSWGGAKVDLENDVFNYTLLVKQLRETLGNRYLLTFAGYCMDKKQTKSGGWQYIDLAAVEPYFDYVCIMTYDFASAPQFQSGIRSPKSYWDIERTVAEYKKAGFPMNKVVLGIPFYARHSFSGTNSAVSYGKLSTLGSGYNLYCWDEESQTPYISYNGQNWGSYDNERSINIKAQYAKSLGMKGLFYWSVYDDDEYYTLSKATWRAVLNNF